VESEKQIEVQRLHEVVQVEERGWVKLCSTCGVRPAKSNKARYCYECWGGSKPCSVEYAVFKEIREGRLKPVKECLCVDCGAPARHYDHRDYNKPTEVDPVCGSCNYKRGGAIPYGRDAKGNWL